VGGLVVGVKSKEIMERREVSLFGFKVNSSNEESTRSYRRLGRLQSIAIVSFSDCSLKKLKESLLQQRERLEDQIAVIRIQQEDEERVKRGSS
jgi:hypothetical protein